MRLDHLLSKETSKMAKAHLSNVLRSVQGLRKFASNVIQFRGYRMMYLEIEVKLIWANSSAG